MDDLGWEFKTAVEEVTEDVVQMARAVELEVDPEEMNELLQSCVKTLMAKELLLMAEQRKWFLEMKSTPGEDAMKSFEMTTKDLEYCINLIDKAAEGFEKIDSDFEISSTLS